MIFIYCVSAAVVASAALVASAAVVASVDLLKFVLSFIDSEEYQKTESTFGNSLTVKLLGNIQFTQLEKSCFRHYCAI